MSVDERELKAAICRAYGSMAAPDYRFVIAQHELRPYRALISELHERFQVEDTADFNYDRGPILSVADGDASCALMLSYVDRLGLLCRVVGRRYCVVERPRCGLDALIINSLVTHQVTRVPATLLAIPSGLIVPGGESLTIFHALFTEAEEVPTGPCT